jgi:hypothetical protein
VRLPIAMAAVYVPTPRFGDDSLTDFHHGLLGFLAAADTISEMPEEWLGLFR